MAQDCKKDRLIEAYNYLYNNGKVHSVTDLADKMGRSRPSVSRAMSGVPEYLNEKFLKCFSDSFPGVFNLDYLLTGEGTLLANETQPATPERVATPTTYDVSILIEKAVEKATAYSDKCIAILEKQVEDLRRGIETRDRVINTLQQKINAMQLEDTLDKYPFHVGIAEPSIPDPEQKHV